MGGYQVKPELLEAVKKEVTATNLQLLKSLQGKEDIFNTTAYIKILFSRYKNRIKILLFRHFSSMLTYLKYLCGLIC